LKNIDISITKLKISTHKIAIKISILAIDNKF